MHSMDVTGLGGLVLGFGLNTQQGSWRLLLLSQPLPLPWCSPPPFLAGLASLVRLCSVLFFTSNGAFFLEGKFGHIPLLPKALQQLPLSSRQFHLLVK